MLDPAGRSYADAPAVRAFRAVAPSRAGIFTDFDGSLSKIVDEPDAARLVPGAAAALRSLVSRYAVVAVVSGRPVHDLIRRVRVRGVRLIGVHGLEERDGGRVRVAPEAEAKRTTVERVARRLAEDVRGLPGVTIERKGLSVAVHFRRCPDPDAAERAAGPRVRAAAVAEGLRVVEARRVLELRPPGGGDKGDAIARLINGEGLEGALVAGDDGTDLAAFAGAKAAARVCCRIGVASAEAPTGLAAEADVLVKNPGELAALFAELAR